MSAEKSAQEIWSSTAARVWRGVRAIERAARRENRLARERRKGRPK